jgi:hypothetical protein
MKLDKLRFVSSLHGVKMAIMGGNFWKKLSAFCIHKLKVDEKRDASKFCDERCVLFTTGAQKTNEGWLQNANVHKKKETNEK